MLKKKRRTAVHRNMGKQKHDLTTTNLLTSSYVLCFSFCVQLVWPTDKLLQSANVMCSAVCECFLLCVVSLCMQVSAVKLFCVYCCLTWHPQTRSWHRATANGCQRTEQTRENVSAVGTLTCWVPVVVWGLNPKQWQDHFPCQCRFGSLWIHGHNNWKQAGGGQHSVRVTVIGVILTLGCAQPSGSWDASTVIATNMMPVWTEH